MLATAITHLLYYAFWHLKSIYMLVAEVALHEYPSDGIANIITAIVDIRLGSSATNIRLDDSAIYQTW